MSSSHWPFYDQRSRENPCVVLGRHPYRGCWSMLEIAESGRAFKRCHRGIHALCLEAYHNFIRISVTVLRLQLDILEPELEILAPQNQTVLYF